MEILSSAWRTDLALLAASGSIVEHHGTWVLVRTPSNPGFWWGNFVLLRRAPSRHDLPRWLDLFAHELPGATHRAFGVDDPDGDLGTLRPLADLGFHTASYAVMTTTELQAPRALNLHAAVRALTTEEDWRQRLALTTAVETEEYGEGHAEFLERRWRQERRLAEAGHGTWFGAFVDGELVSSLGVFRAGGDLARFQSVQTHPAHRRRGLACTLVHTAGMHALHDLGAARLVIVADPDHPAARVYARVGFVSTEHQLQAELAPAVRPPGS